MAINLPRPVFPKGGVGSAGSGGTPDEPEAGVCQTAELPTGDPPCGGPSLEPGCRRIASSQPQPDGQVEGSVIKHEPCNKRREGTAEGSIRPAAGTSYTASRAETVGPGSNLPAHVGQPGGTGRAPRRGIRPIDAPQEVLGPLARRRRGGITDLSSDTYGRTGGIDPMKRQPADVEIDRNNPVIHSSAELSYSQARARQPVDPRGV